MICAIYGLDPEAPIFRGRTPDEIAMVLSSWNVNAVFGAYKDRELRRALRGRDIMVFAELACFVGESHWKRGGHPVNDHGEAIRRIKWYAGTCPTHEGNRADIIKRAEKLVSKHELDGIWLDFLRYPAHWEVPEPYLEQTCFCPRCIRLFQKQAGVTLPKGLSTREKAHRILAQHKDAWVRFKTDTITSLAREVRRAVRKAHPHILVGLFAVPWDREERGGAVISVLGQDHRDLAREIDVISPMVYHGLMGKPPGWITGVTARAARDTERPVWPIVFSGNKEHPIEPAEFRAAAEAAWQEPSSGLIVFSFGHLQKMRRLEEIPKVFERCSP